MPSSAPNWPHPPTHPPHEPGATHDSIQESAPDPIATIDQACAILASRKWFGAQVHDHQERHRGGPHHSPAPARPSEPPTTRDAAAPLPAHNAPPILRLLLWPSFDPPEPNPAATDNSPTPPDQARRPAEHPDQTQPAIAPPRPLKPTDGAQRAPPAHRSHPMQSPSPARAPVAANAALLGLPPRPQGSPQKNTQPAQLPARRNKHQRQSRTRALLSDNKPHRAKSSHDSPSDAVPNWPPRAGIAPQSPPPRTRAPTTGHQVHSGFAGHQSAHEASPHRAANPFCRKTILAHNFRYRTPTSEARHHLLTVAFHKPCCILLLSGYRATRFLCF